MTQRELPASPDIEAAVLSRLLLNPEQVGLASEGLTSESFSDPERRSIWLAMEKLAGLGRIVDVQTIAAELGWKSSRLSRCIEAPTGMERAPVEDYIAILKGTAFRRHAITKLQNVLEGAYTLDDPMDFMADLSSAVQSIGEQVSGGEELIDPATAAASYQAELTMRQGGQSRGLTYGIGDLDRLLQPARPGDMIVVAARPSIGKTAFAENVAESWSQQGEGPVLFASLEMSLMRLLDRAVARTADLDSDLIVRGALTDSQYDLARASAGEIANVGIWYLDDPSATTSSIRAAAARMKLLCGNRIGAIIIDYLQLLRDPGEQEVQRVTRISRAIKALALEFDCPVLVLSQLNRSVEAREDHRPRLHDLRESGAIEQDADVVIAISRTGNEATFAILKQRHGVSGTEASLRFDGPRVRWTDGWERYD